MKTGPLSGLKAVELAGLGPGSLAAMILADLGADVVRVDRATPGEELPGAPKTNPLARGRRSVGINTKAPEGVELVLKLCDTADVFIETFRPGTAERIGLGPDVMLARNPRLVYGRLTGWGQDGPLAKAAAHDINYAGIVGALEPNGHAGERPAPLPIKIGFCGGGLQLAVGVLAALYERNTSGKGQTVDASMVDGAALLTIDLHSGRAAGLLGGNGGENILDGDAPYYAVYETADNKHVAVGAVEPRLWDELVKMLELDAEELPSRIDKSNWPKLREILGCAIAKHTRDELAARADGTDACLTPVLSPSEVVEHPHNVARGAFVDIDGMIQTTPAPRFDRTPPATPEAPHAKGSDTEAVLAEIGIADLGALRDAKVIA
jgi:alpha-methylacyl-CoA racemase